jgi:nicotinamide-nucleotide amidase
MTGPGAELVAIGSELLGPDRTDSNGAFLTRRLGEAGIVVRFRTIVGDTPADLEAVLRTALSRCEVVIATGGLGPTVDDLTREAAAAVLGLPLDEDAAILRDLEDRHRSRGLGMPPGNRRQAQVPRGATVIANPLGSAPGLALPHEGRILILLPGVPSEMRAMFDAVVTGLLPASEDRFATRILKIAGLAESEVDHRLAEVARSAAPVEWTILAEPGQVEIHLRERVRRGAGTPGIDRVDAACAAILGDRVFGRDTETIEEVVGRQLLARRETVATAESLTGGLIAARLSAVPGASAWLAGGLICYGAPAKIGLAGVDPGLIAVHGAVSAEVAEALAAGARAALGATWGVAASGYAGPEGGPEGPPGTVFVALAGAGVRRHAALRLPGDRDAVRTRSARSAIDLLRRSISGDGPA